MPRTYVPKGKPRVTYSSEAMQKALRAVKNQGLTLKLASQTYGVPLSTLGKHYKEEGIVNIKGGRKTALSAEDEAAIATYLQTLSSCGEGLTRSEVLKLVSEYVKTNNIGQSYWNNRSPGNDWFNNFLKRHPHLSMRKGELLPAHRQKGADPFTVHKFYEDWENILKEADIDPEKDSGLIYNCDETGFNHDLKDIRVVAAKGTKRISKNIPGSGKKNTTVLACGSAGGQKLPPLIVFSGKYVWSSWIPKTGAYPGTCYTAQKKGWMEGGIFEHWFKNVFLKEIPAEDIRGNKKVILLYDGATFHTSLELAKTAVKNNVVLVRLPPNLTHFMQPLDKTVFKPIKNHWNQLMIEYSREHAGVPLPNEEFAKKLAVVWEESFKPKNLRSGFESTGLLPVNPEKFPTTAYDQIKLKRFFEYKKNNKKIQQETTDERCSTVITGSQIDTERPSTTPEPQPGPSTSITTNVPDFIHKPVGLLDYVPEKPSDKKQKTPTPKKTIGLTKNKPTPSKRTPSKVSPFEMFIREKLSETKDADIKTQPIKRKRLTFDVGSIITSDEAIKKMEEQQQEQLKTEMRKSKGGIKTKSGKLLPIKRVPVIENKKKTKKLKTIITSSDSEQECRPSEIELKDSSSEWNELTSEESDNENAQSEKVNLLLEKYYTVYYDETWYLAKLVDFYDEDSSKFKFLKKNLEQFYWPPQGREETEIVKNHFIFHGPVKLLGSGPFSLKRYETNLIDKKYKTMKKNKVKA